MNEEWEGQSVGAMLVHKSITIVYVCEGDGDLLRAANPSGATHIPRLGYEPYAANGSVWDVDGFMLLRFLKHQPNIEPFATGAGVGC